MPTLEIVIFLISHILVGHILELLPIFLGNSAEARIFLNREDWDLLRYGLKLGFVHVHSWWVMTFKILFAHKGQQRWLIINANFWRPRECSEWLFYLQLRTHATRAALSSGRRWSSALSACWSLTRLLVCLWSQGWSSRPVPSHLRTSESASIWRTSSRSAF